jgi:hypothetical protein
MAQRARSARTTISKDALRSALKSQYRAALAMLRAAIRQCPDGLWTSGAGHANPFWRIAYHTLYYTDLYLQPNNRAFRPWEHHRRGIQHMDSPVPKTGRPYTKAEVLTYWNICESLVDHAVDALDLTSAQSGFSWYKIPKIEHQLVNIRHIQYHQAQLADRLRAATGTGVDWAGARRPRRWRTISVASSGVSGLRR